MSDSEYYKKLLNQHISGKSLRTLSIQYEVSRNTIRNHLVIAKREFEHLEEYQDYDITAQNELNAKHERIERQKGKLGISIKALNKPEEEQEKDDENTEPKLSAKDLLALEMRKLELQERTRQIEIESNTKIKLKEMELEEKREAERNKKELEEKKLAFTEKKIEIDQQKVNIQSDKKTTRERNLELKKLGLKPFKEEDETLFFLSIEAKRLLNKPELTAEEQIEKEQLPSYYDATLLARFNRWKNAHKDTEEYKEGLAKAIEQETELNVIRAQIARGETPEGFGLTPEEKQQNKHKELTLEEKSKLSMYDQEFFTPFREQQIVKDKINKEKE